MGYGNNKDDINAGLNAFVPNVGADAQSCIFYDKTGLCNTA